MVSLKSPELPVVQIVPHGKLEVGQKLVVKGEVLDSADRFCINFIQHSSNHRVFHLDFRFRDGEHQTVRNTNFPSGAWGSEERSDNPLSKGQNFVVEVKVEEDHFEVEVNDHHHCKYHHRAPLSVIDAFEIKGGAKIKSIKLKD